jgi:hypothetical protein
MIRSFPYLFVLILLFGSSNLTQGQSPEGEKFDSLYHSSKTAAIKSTVLPGWGQAYNQKHYKIPIIYAAIGTSVFFMLDNTRLYKAYRDEYTWRQEGGNPDEGRFPSYTDENLQDLANSYRSNRDMAAVFAVLFYVLNIVDASVDAHFFGFDVSDDLSFDLRPGLINGGPTPYPNVGLSLQLKL